MEGVVTDKEIPQWKRDLILRIKNKYKWPLNEQQQLLAGTSRNLSGTRDRDGQEPNLTFSNAAAVPVVSSSGCDKLNCNVNSLPLKSSKMVQECSVDYDRYNQYNSNNDILENGSDKSDDSGSSEELHYGPGIVNKLKNRYLSLTLRENNAKPRPSILCMRKATSLENLLEGDEVPNKLPVNSKYKGNKVNKHTTSKYYYNATRGSDLKRARSVEAISRIADQPKEPTVTINETRLKHQSLHEDMLIIKEGNDKLLEKICDNINSVITTENKVSSNTVNHRINRPKRITPVMSEREKPPIDVVKQTKRIFEGKPDQRTKVPHQTGDVAAKVATYKNIIGQTKCNKKPIIKQKPVVHPEDRKPPSSPTKPGKLQLKIGVGWINNKENSVSSTSPSSAVSLIPDVSRIINNNIETSFHHNQSNISSNLSETPDLILHSSPVKSASSPTFKILATDNFLKAEITHSNSDNHKNEYNFGDDRKLLTRIKLSSPTKDEVEGFKIEARNNIKPNGNASPPYNISPQHLPRSNLPVIENESRNNNKSKFSPDKHTFSKPNVKTEKNSQLSPTSPSKPITVIQHNLSPQEIEKNKINTAKTLEQSFIKNIPNVAKTVEEVKKVEVPKFTSKPKETRDQNSIVFKFTDRKDVPDYVYNDGKIRTGKIEKPKVGEGGITFLPGVSLDESLVDDDDEEWKTSLEAPPSPCNVEFVNDNVIFEGRSSLSQKSKKSKEMKIQFETVPDVYEYPSEASLLDDFSSPPLETSSGHTVPTLSGSTLSNYIPKSGSTEDFQLGITRSITPPSQAVNENFQNEETLEDIDEPVLFSSGTNSDILF